MWYSIGMSKKATKIFLLQQLLNLANIGIDVSRLPIDGLHYLVVYMDIGLQPASPCTVPMPLLRL